MASRKSGEASDQGSRVNVPAQEDEDDILEEVGAERDEETGELVADVKKIRELGAADPVTVREERRLDRVADKKKKGEKGVSFGTDDPIVIYDTLLKVWGPNSIYIRVKRLTGAQVTHQIKSCPRSGSELYEAVMTAHGQSPEAEYELKFHSTDGHQWRGTGRITLPDTRPASQQGQPMQPPYYQAPSGVMPPGYLPPQAPPQPGAPLDPMTMFRQMFELVQSVQPQPMPVVGPPMPQLVAPPMPTSMDPASMMEWFKQMMDLVQRSQARAAPQQPQAQPQFAAPAMQGPTTAPPRGMMWAWMPEMGAFALVPAPSAAPPAGPMYRGPNPRAPYYPQGDPNERSYSPQMPQQRSQSPTEHFREMIGTVRTARAFAEELGSITGGGHQGGGQVDDDPMSAGDPDSPIDVVDTGKGKLIYGKQDGSLRGWDTFLTNLPEFLKWGGEQVDKINKAAASRQQREQQQLPEYAGIPVDRSQRSGLPPPPEEMPPPIHTTPQRRSWDQEG